MSKRHPSKRSSEEKRRLDKELALLFIAQTIVATFLVLHLPPSPLTTSITSTLPVSEKLTQPQTNTTTLAFPPDWSQAMEVLRRNGDTAKTEHAIKKLMRSGEDAEVVRLARRE